MMCRFHSKIFIVSPVSAGFSVTDYLRGTYHSISGFDMLLVWYLPLKSVTEYGRDRTNNINFAVEFAHLPYNSS